jgi:hypothetical protein
VTNHLALHEAPGCLLRLLIDVTFNKQCTAVTDTCIPVEEFNERFTLKFCCLCTALAKFCLNLIALL